ncbi:E3 ubiquitin-protein ligase RNF169-like [Leptopilina boulardi]|uniref:E3 ubiquitin-protein ligase RNF169-like n=1 Tax=Leptopilina boulardi TaxID=63433 RepID=UPI0021F613F9|nr:E3 ubiquitin-protein ligase RNF169-like [Leptopilina boulardi]
MATCLKRTSKLFDPSLCRSSSYANLRDLLCPVCRAILIEPVTLPCEHNLCLSCLNGTIQHNNLNCPLCRTRVGSWLRTNSKSNTLVNIRLWEIIRTKFPKEVEGRRNGEDTDIDLDSGYAARTKILSAAGEIRKEYETQLQLEEEEKRRKQQAETIASEALIRKIQAEEQQQLAQLAQDELLAKTLAKKEIRTKFDAKMKTEPLSKTVQKTKTQNNYNCDEPIITKFKSAMHSQKTNIALISKIRAESYASSIKSTGLNQCKDAVDKLGSYKTLPVQDTVTRLFKNQVTKFIQPSGYNFNLEPSCSKIYGLQSKEELHVPNDVLNSKKKNVEVEICVTTVTDDSRIGSAESAGSHDSINQEIHHFKPIKAMPRTALRTTRDGRQIDTKLIRVVPILKRVSNFVPKTPSLSSFKRIPSCSWSAFKGKIKDSKSSSMPSKIENLESIIKPVAAPVQIVTISGTLVKPQVSDSLDLPSEMSFDTNKNIKKIINGTKISKKLNLEESDSCDKMKKIYDSPVKNGTLRKNKRKKNRCNNSDDSFSDSDIIDSQSINSTKSDISEAASNESQKDNSNEEIPIENIAERIKKRKTNIDKRYNNNTDDFVRRSLRKRSTAIKYITESSESFDEFSDGDEELPKRKRPRKGAPKLIKETEIIKNSNSKIRNQPPELTREVPIANKRRGRRRKTKSPIEEKAKDDDDEEEVEVNDDFNTVDNSEKQNNSNTEKATDDEIIDEQKRIEMLLRQEQEDREMAERLQAQFNEWENMAGRTRNSRRALEIGNNNTEDLNLGLGKRERRTTNSHINKQLNQTTSSSRSQRKRPQPRALK